MRRAWSSLCLVVLLAACSTSTTTTTPSTSPITLTTATTVEQIASPTSSTGATSVPNATTSTTETSPPDTPTLAATTEVPTIAAATTIAATTETAVATTASTTAEVATTTAATAETTSAATTETTTSVAATTGTTSVTATKVVEPPVKITLPDGFGISVYAEDLGSPRFMAYGPDGTLYVTDIDGGRVLALPDANHDGLADSTTPVISGLSSPHGIAFHDGAMYIGETNQISRFTQTGTTWGDKQVIVPNLPSGAGHRTRTVIFGADNKMYVSVGSSCNVCQEESPQRAAVWQYNADGSGGRLYTKGLRNAVGMILRPNTSEIWATNNGRDQMGNDVPPETINILQDGADYGWPRCHAGDIIDPEFGSSNSCDGVHAPAIKMQAHSAPLGLRFYDGTMFPAEYRGNLFVAFHGSWNRTVPTGYKVVRIPIDTNGKAGPIEDFASGWLQSNGSADGRPVDVIVAPDGALLVTDDAEGRIYRIFYQK